MANTYRRTLEVRTYIAIHLLRIILAETSDKFVAILNIVKQQDARIEDLEEELSDTIDTVSQLEDDWRDRMDEVYEANQG